MRLTRLNDKHGSLEHSNVFNQHLYAAGFSRLFKIVLITVRKRFGRTVLFPEQNGFGIPGFFFHSATDGDVRRRRVKTITCCFKTWGTPTVVPGSTPTHPSVNVRWRAVFNAPFRRWRGNLCSPGVRRAKIPSR